MRFATERELRASPHVRLIGEPSAGGNLQQAESSAQIVQYSLAESVDSGAASL
jgi:hypothetical protein